jgi:hypothetical protein
MLPPTPSVRLGTVVALLGAVLAAAGCGPGGPKLAPVRGTITYQGARVPHGTVMFQPDNGPAAIGEIHNGAYSLKTDTRNGALLGPHKVTVISLTDQSARLPEDRNPLSPPLVPLHYSFPDKSGLSAVVEDKDNVVDFDLK